MDYYAVADRLNMSISQVLKMTVSEFEGWKAYIKLMKNND